jgi:hypothetical protein
MNSIPRKSNRTNECGLNGVIESLAAYICAADRPQATLKSALAAVVRQVAETNRIANARVAAMRESRIALPA